MQEHNQLKKQIRELIAARKACVSEATKITWSQKISDRLIQTDLFQKANCIALYYALSDEVRTAGLLDSWYQKKKIVLPVVSGENMHFYSYSGKDMLIKGMLGVSEPDTTGMGTELVPPEMIDLFIVPGIAFDRAGHRMGRGKGYYDRYLNGINRPVIGLCFGFQVLPEIPVEPHDQPMTYIITEDFIVS